MKIDFSTVIKDLDNNPVKQSAEPNAPDATLGGISVQALLSDIPNENPSSADKVARFNLATKLHNAKEVDLKAEDITLLKSLVGKLYTPLVVGRAYEILDPPAT